MYAGHYANFFTCLGPIASPEFIITIARHGWERWECEPETSTSAFFFLSTQSIFREIPRMFPIWTLKKHTGWCSSGSVSVSVCSIMSWNNVKQLPWSLPVSVPVSIASVSQSTFEMKPWQWQQSSSSKHNVGREQRWHCCLLTHTHTHIWTHKRNVYTEWKKEYERKNKLQKSYFIHKINKMYNHNANFTHCCQVCLSLKKDLFETYQQCLMECPSEEFTWQVFMREEAQQ